MEETYPYTSDDGIVIGVAAAVVCSSRFDVSVDICRIPCEKIVQNFWFTCKDETNVSGSNIADH